MGDGARGFCGYNAIMPYGTVHGFGLGTWNTTQPIPRVIVALEGGGYVLKKKKKANVKSKIFNSIQLNVQSNA